MTNLKAIPILFLMNKLTIFLLVFLVLASSGCLQGFPSQTLVDENEVILPGDSLTYEFTQSPDEVETCIKVEASDFVYVFIYDEYNYKKFLDGEDATAIDISLGMKEYEKNVTLLAQQSRLILFNPGNDSLSVYVKIIEK